MVRGLWYGPAHDAPLGDRAHEMARVRENAARRAPPAHPVLRLEQLGQERVAARPSDHRGLGALGLDHAAQSRGARGEGCVLSRRELAEGTQPRVYVEHFTWKDPAGKPLHGKCVLTEPMGTEMKYSLSGAWSSEALVRFVGLCPRSKEPTLGEVLAGLADHLDALDESVQWLASVRSMPLGVVRVLEGITPALAPDGSDTVAILQQMPDVLTEVNGWLQEHARRTLELRQIAPGFVQPELRHAVSTHTQRLADHGEGLLQVLPVLTALARTRTTNTVTVGPRILAVEDPESHLHPRLQYALANHIAEVVKSDDPPVVVLETHSQHLLLAVQLAVVQGLSPERVALYWVEQDDEGVSEAVRIHIQPNGDLDGWPPGVYDDVVDMAREVIERRWGIGR